MKVYAEYFEENGKGYRGKTLLQFGDSTKLIGSAVLMNPGSAKLAKELDKADEKTIRSFYGEHHPEEKIDLKTWSGFSAKIYKVKIMDYKNCFKNILMALIGCAMLFVSCTNDENDEKNEPEKSAACAIVSFSVNGVSWSINSTDITYAYPSGTEATALTPIITLSTGATVNPASGIAQDFFSPQGVTYTVTAEDSVTTETYTAKATIQAIDSGITGECTWVITGAAGSYTLTISGNGAMADYGYYDGDDYKLHGSTPWDKYHESITSLVIRDGVTTIGIHAFTGCSGLTGSLTIPNSVTTIGDGAFYDCSELTGSLTIPNLVSTIGDYAFARCSGLTGSLTIGNSVTTIGDSAFYYCWGLTGSLIIPNLVTTIGKWAFYDCYRLTGSLTIGNSVTSIGRGAFYNCSGLTAINVDAGNMHYNTEDGVLFNKDKTTLLCYPVGKTKNNYVIPNSVTAISERAFYNCRGFTGSLTISNSVTTIGTSAFEGCIGLTGSLTIPNSVTTIGDGAFAYCSGFTGSLTIGNSVTTIDIYAFSDCSGFGSLTIGNSVTTIGDLAFSGCSGFTSVTNLNPVPQGIYNNVFRNINALTLSVIAGSIAAYQAANVWKDFGNIVAIP